MVTRAQMEQVLASGYRTQPSRTYAMVGNRVAGKLDGLDAVRQAVWKALQTRRYAFRIYSGNYGSEIYAVLGESAPDATGTIERYIREAVAADDRVRAVEQLRVEHAGDAVAVSFTVVSQYGNTAIAAMEV